MLTGISIIIVLLIFVFMVELIIPLNLEIEFKNICREYYLQIEKNGGLSKEEAAELEERLTEIGLDVKKIIYSEVGSISKNERIQFYVDCIYKTKELSNITQRDTAEYHFLYEKSIISRMIIN